MRDYGKDLTPFSALEFLSLFNRENLSFFSARVLRRQAGVVLLCLFFTRFVVVVVVLHSLSLFLL
jgi:hypothetical protein